jgi:hypothetical protein
MALVFEWDPAKDASNRRKHGISFEAALSVFADPLARIFPDEDHSEPEEREIIVGSSSVGRLLVVSFISKRASIRLLSARLATRHERKDYEEDSRSR